MVDNELEMKVDRLNDLVDRWRLFFALYRKIQKPGEATPKEEHDFEEMATSFARIYSPIATRAGLKAEPGCGVLDMITAVPDAEGVRGLSEMQRRKFESDWRSNNTMMNQKLGELQLLREELVHTTDIAYHAKRLFSNKTVQWTVGSTIIILALWLVGFFNMLYRLLHELIQQM